jgi:DNA anti-recombination protein RmuC
MNQLEIILVFNSLLLGIIGYFLKDLHKEFKVLIERVNKIHTDFYSHQQIVETLNAFNEKQIERLEKRIEKLEGELEGYAGLKAS